MATTTEPSKTATGTAATVESTHAEAAQDRLTAGERRAAQLTRAGGPDPFPPYDLMTLQELRDVAAELKVAIPPDVEKALLVTELRAHRSGTLSVARLRGA